MGKVASDQTALTLEILCLPQPLLTACREQIYRAQHVTGQQKARKLAVSRSTCTAVLTDAVNTLRVHYTSKVRGKEEIERIRQGRRLVYWLDGHTHVHTKSSWHVSVLKNKFNLFLKKEKRSSQLEEKERNLNQRKKGNMFKAGKSALPSEARLGLKKVTLVVTFAFTWITFCMAQGKPSFTVRGKPLNQ